MSDETDPRLGLWREMDSAPRDGAWILGLIDLNNDSYEYAVVWWTDDPDYPWATDGNARTEDRLAYWQPLPPMPVFEDMSV